MRFSCFFMTMTISSCCLLIICLNAVIAKNAKRKFDGDFEFAEDDSRVSRFNDKKKWMHVPNNELCLPLNCKKSEVCLLEDTFTAVCVSKTEFYKSRSIVISKSKLEQHQIHMDTSAEIDDAFFDSEDDDDDQDETKCQQCPVSNPVFFCGSDNRTYSSICRLEYHNCIHRSNVRINCMNFCPCKDSKHMHLRRLQLQHQSKKSYKLTFTPKNFNYDNHHYQYVKYSKGNKYNAKYLVDKIMKKQNLPLQSNRLPQNSKECPSSSKPAMANRLLDWFSVVIADSKHQQQRSKSKGHFPIGCQTEVQWMFGHLDTDNNGKISLLELYGLEHDQNEPCLKPFLDACDINSDVFVSGPEWCGCFSKAERPCAVMRRRASPEVTPNCDSRGYYQSTQCHQRLNLCWCVDQHGIEFAGTRTRGLKPNCDSIVNKISSNLKTNSVNFVDDEDPVQDLEGSADIPLDF
ncbi:PREDICTED: testican-3 [Ceratosolen solmsi marchali]|uniref:Testican-3 n=1 Tax=Ceratosolen solmsi marchali TaxID=326594 RepID=A0AAJ6YR72_9HYME|nr:PREDICTED: testican-3 [Ceratosolen solmsi marchali]